MERRQFITSGLALAGAAGLSASAFAQHNASPDTSFDPSLWIGDLAIVNARIITMDPSRPEAQAVLVRNGRIAAVGSNAEIRGRARGARVLDAGGSAVVPGFVDTHVHIEWSCAARELMVNLWNPAPQSVAELLTRLKAVADKTPAGQWIVAEGPLGQMADKRMPTLDELDSVTQRHPLAVFNGVHHHVNNSLAAQGMGYLTYESEAQMRWWSNGEPFTGGWAKRDEHGHPGDSYDMVMRLPRDLWSVEALKGAIRKQAKAMFVAGGVTSASPVCLVSSNEYSADQQLQAMGELPLRLRAYYMAPFSVGVDQVLATGVTRGFGNDMFRTGGFKLIMDASHPGAPTAQHYTEDEFADLVTKIHARGLQTITHCTSPQGADRVTNAIEEVRRRFPNGPEIRHRIEHHRARPELARRIKAAGMYFSLIAAQARTQNRNANTGSGFSSSVSLPYRSYIADGIHPILVSDKCSGAPSNPKPLMSIAAACNGYEAGGMTDASETVGFDDALRMWTLWAAESTHQEHDRGSITVGKLGDFALLSGDPRRMQPAEYFDLKVDATVLGGKVVYES
ncbi:amidohydrolase [Phenylobacterium sp.]|uniref:amidohydrolase n=1 Tax=Phenylobacterium sp. TaxID=1871053 RepID=UPI0037834C0E